MNRPSARPAESDLDAILELMPRLYVQDGLRSTRRSPGRRWPESRATVLFGRLGDPHGPEPIGYMILTLGYSLEYRGRDAFVDELFVVESRGGRDRAEGDAGPQRAAAS